jgi:phytanoyl-CoA hydroxylase
MASMPQEILLGVEFFQQQGFLILRQDALPDVIHEMRKVTEHDLANSVEPIEYEADVQYPGAPETRSALGGKTVRRLKNAMVRHPIFIEWLRTSRSLQFLQQLLGTPLVCPMAHHNCIMTKQPSFSSDTGWHQDIRYWSYQRPELVSVWLALGAENKNNGCLQLIPGTHQMPLKPQQFDDLKFFKPDLPENKSIIEQAILAEMDAGDVLLFHCRTLHAATRNFSQDPKWAFVTTLRPFDNPPVPGTRSTSQPEILFPEV